MLAVWIGAIMDAIEVDQVEPDTWEALYLVYSMHALTQGSHCAALKFGEMVLLDLEVRRPERLQPDGPQPVKLADLRRAAELPALRKPNPAA